MCVSVTERKLDFNPFTAKAGKISRGEKCLQIAYFNGPITSLFSILSILAELFLRARATGKKDPNDSKFGVFVSRFESDGLASMAVKGLIYIIILMYGIREIELDAFFFFFFFAKHIVVGRLIVQHTSNTITCSHSFILHSVY